MWPFRGCDGDNSNGSFWSTRSLDVEEKGIGTKAESPLSPMLRVTRTRPFKGGGLAVNKGDDEGYSLMVCCSSFPTLCLLA